MVADTKPAGPLVPIWGHNPAGRTPAVEVVDRLPEEVRAHARSRARRVGAALDRALPALTSPRRVLARWAEALSERFRDASTATRSALRAGHARAALAAHQIQETLTPARGAAHRGTPEPRRALLQRARQLTHRLRDRLELGDPPAEDASHVTPHPPSGTSAHSSHARSASSGARPAYATVRSTIDALRSRLTRR